MAAKLQDVEVLLLEAVAWAAGVEGTAAQMAQTMGRLRRTSGGRGGASVPQN
jgi:hypothetical protein